MKKNDVFAFTAPNGAKVVAIVLNFYNAKLYESYIGSRECIAYAQNRLFTCKMTFKRKYFWGQVPHGENNPVVLDKVTGINPFVDYAILPDYDELLAKYNNLEIALKNII